MRLSYSRTDFEFHIKLTSMWIALLELIELTPQFFLFHRRSLELVEEKPVSQPMVMSDDVDHLTSLIYNFDYQQDFKEPIDLKMPHYFYHLTGRKVPITDVSENEITPFF